MRFCTLRNIALMPTARFLVLACWWAATFSLPAQTPADNGAAEVNADAIRSFLQGLDQNPALSQETKSTITSLCLQALRYVQEAQDTHATAEGFQAMIESVPNDLAALRKEMEALTSPPAETSAQTPNLPDLESAISAAQSTYDSLQREFDQLNLEPQLRNERKKALSQRIQALTQELEKSPQAESSPQPGEPPELTQARSWLARAAYEAKAAELEAAQKEMEAYEKSAELLNLKTDLTQKKLIQAERILKQLQELRTEAREREAKKIVENTRAVLESVARGTPEIQRLALSLAQQNADLAAERVREEGITAKLTQLKTELEQIQQQRRQLADSFQNITERLRTSGLTGAVGNLLRRQFLDLPSLNELHREAAQRQAEMVEVEGKLTDLREARRKLTTSEESLQESIRSLPNLSEYEKRKILKVITDLGNNQRDLLQGLQQDYEAYFNLLLDYLAANAELARLVEQIADFIREHILWVRSTQLLFAHSWREIVEGLAWTFTPAAWTSFAAALSSDCRQRPVLYAALAVLLLFIILVSGRLRTPLKVLGAEASKRRNVRFRPTTLAALYTVVRGLIPSVALCAVYLLTAPLADISAQVSGAYAALRVLVPALGIWGIFFAALSPDGLVVKHFLWPTALVRGWRFGLLVFGLPAIFALALPEFYETQAEEVLKSTLGRLSFLLALVLQWLWLTHAVWMYRTRYARRSSVSPRSARLVYALYAINTVLLAVLGTLSVLGYSYTAYLLFYRLVMTWLLLVTLAIAMAFISRYLTLARRRLALESVLEAEKDEEGGAGETEDETLFDLTRINEQTRRVTGTLLVSVLLVGLWVIWSDIIPALRMLERIPIVRYSVEATPNRAPSAPTQPQEQAATPSPAPGASETTPTGPGTAAAPDTATTPGKEVVTPEVPAGSQATTGEGIYVSLADVIFAAVIAMLTWLLASNLPGLLEMFLRRRMDYGERYAVITVVRYCVVLLGMVGVAQSLGIRWSSIQWLVAALGVGLGFGLQEIFANFISGIILLFERPIRIGDIVTINNISGTVTRMRVRSTTIVNFEQKELVVPNKDFITGQLINWTLSNRMIRAVLNVGIAYGSDVRRAEQILYEIARDSEWIAAEPPPRVIFKAFGESSLDFELRVFCRDVERYFDVVNYLHFEVNRRFQSAGIEIAFPQRDLHLRSGFEVLAASAGQSASLRACVEQTEPKTPPTVDEHSTEHRVEG